MSRRFQFTLRALLLAMLVAAAFFGGIRFERERQRREAAGPAGATMPAGTVDVQITHAGGGLGDIDERLKEAVVSRIEMTTPYKAAYASDADSRLSIYIDSKAGLVTVEWTDRQRTLLRPRSTFRLRDGSEQKTVDDLARPIVTTMQTPW